MYDIMKKIVMLFVLSICMSGFLLSAQAEAAVTGTCTVSKNHPATLLKGTLTYDYSGPYVRNGRNAKVSKMDGYDWPVVMYSVTKDIILYSPREYHLDTITRVTEFGETKGTLKYALFTGYTSGY